MDTLNAAIIEARAKLAWKHMNDNEKTCVRFGLIPHWTVLDGMEGREPMMPALRIDSGTDQRDFAVALFSIAKQNGGMVA